MPPNSDSSNSLDWLSADLKITLARLESLKKGNIIDLFSHIRKRNLGAYQKAWEIACMRQLSNEGFIIFDDTDGEIVLTSGNLSSILKNSDKIWELVVKAYDSATGSSIWNEALAIATKTEEQLTPIVQEPIVAPPILEPEPTLISTLEPEPTHDSDEDLEEDLEEDPDSIVDITNNELSWDRIYEFFPENKAAVLISFRESIGKLISGGKWTRPELFPEPCNISVELQRDFLKSALEEGLIEKEGERKSRKYWLSQSRDDYDSFSLIARLVYPNTILDVSINEPRVESQQFGDYDESSILDQFVKVLTLQAQSIKTLEQKIDSQSLLIEELKSMISRLPGASDGK
jgi:hypothetical protein